MNDSPLTDESRFSTIHKVELPTRIQRFAADFNEHQSHCDADHLTTYQTCGFAICGVDKDRASSTLAITVIASSCCDEGHLLLDQLEIRRFSIGK